MSRFRWEDPADYPNAKAELEAEVETLREEVKNLIDEKAKLRDALEEVLEWARDNQDVVDGDDGQPQPDAVMRIGNMVEEALGRGGKFGF
jgi:predicted nuclease with TOPRIM domain